MWRPRLLGRRGLGLIWLRRLEHCVFDNGLRRRCTLCGRLLQYCALDTLRFCYLLLGRLLEHSSLYLRRLSSC